ncbi:hypothetical protein AbraIFM66951_006273 [Aspergillus brasiliensis]|uniref:Uncharacterized protein n=1 Tax=Aspergillus brasiliensis TaxID=319629 RepID=A0A9W5Z3A6_9EURO|nr:hypothetical protein AbraCBS73388_005468 [Aspergillus brasiliensis]GKZ51623.1 hypothetical protein AbraIFM66951_006273 [Aspergillus brasiliensis]
MASPRSFSGFLSFLLLSQLSSFVSAAPWIVTADYQEVVTTARHYYTTYTTTLIEQITPTVTSMPEPISTATSLGSSNYYYYYNDDDDTEKDVTIIQELYPTGVGSVVDDYDYGYGYGSDDDDDEYHSTKFVVNITYSAPTGCSSRWTQTTAVEVNPPTEVQDLLPRTAVATSISVDSVRPFQPTTYTIDIVYVDPTQLPTSSLESMSLYNRPTSLYTASSCAYTGSSGSGYYSGSYYGDYGYDDDYNWFTDDYWMGISPLALTLILTLGWIGLFLILGFIEAWIRFRRLMMGWQTRRGLPVCWSLTILPFTLLLLCFFRKGYRARSDADGEVLRKRWKAMGFWTKLRLYFVWGFRYKYPPVLGPAPARVKTSKQPGKNPGPRLLEPSPSPSVAPQSRPGSAPAPTAAAASGAIPVPPPSDPEMGTISSTPVAHATEAAVGGEAAVPPPTTTVPEAPPHHQDEEIGRAN